MLEYEEDVEGAVAIETKQMVINPIRTTPGADQQCN